MIKIIMDSGKEYQVQDCSIEDIINRCYITNEIPSPYGNGAKVKSFSVKFINISDKIVINTNHISSIEEE